MPRIWLLLNGDFAFPDRLPMADEPIIAVDGGIRHAEQLSVQPSLWLGDFDSSVPKMAAAYPQLSQVQFPSEKDQTDFELALAYAAKFYPEHERHVIGSAGDEADHAFGNVWLLPTAGKRILLWQPQATLFCGNGRSRLRFRGKIGDTVSLFALAPLKHVQNRGLKWPLKNATLAPHQALAARNRLTAEEAEICWQEGSGLVFLPRHAEILANN